MRPVRTSEPYELSAPSTSKSCFTPIGMPCSGPRVAATLRLGIRFLGFALGSFVQHVDERTELAVEPLDAIRHSGKLFNCSHRPQFWRQTAAFAHGE